MDTLPAVGEYHVLALGSDSPVAISTLRNAELADKLAELKPRGLSIVGKTETENIGVEKIIKNVLAVPFIRYLIVCGQDSEGHCSGNTLVSLFENGIDEKKKVINSKGKKPVLINTETKEIEAFRNHIEIVNMIGNEAINEILNKIEELLNMEISSIKSNEKSTAANNNSNSTKIDIVFTEEKDPYKVKLDKEGYFVIVPKTNSKTILVEHYSNKNQLLHIIKGENARNIYWTIIDNNWVSELSHAAYLGKELTIAEMSIKTGIKYVQDKA